MPSLLTIEKWGIRAELSLLRCTLIMSRAFRIGLALAVLFAVAAVLIAPTIDMPETTLREHQVASHFSNEHGTGNLASICVPGASFLLTVGIEKGFSGRTLLSEPPRVPSSRVLRC